MFNEYLITSKKASLVVLKLIQIAFIILFMVFTFKCNSFLMFTSLMIFGILEIPIKKIKAEILYYQTKKEDEMNDFRNEIRITLKILEEMVYNLNYGKESLNLLHEKYLNCESEIDFILLKIELYAFYSELHRKEQFKKGFSQDSKNKTNYNTQKSGIIKNLKVLGLSEDVRDLSIIKKQYRKMMHKYHPDVNKSSNALSISQSINIAYAELQKALN